MGRPSLGALVRQAARPSASNCKATAPNGSTFSRSKTDGIFNPDAVSRLVQKFRDGKAIGVKDDMALVGILSTQVIVDRFINHFPLASSLPSLVGATTHGHA